MEECKYSFFISYSHTDKHLVDSIKEELNKAEITYWVDSKLKVGERHGFTQDIAQAINDSRFVLFVWSQSSNDSSFVSKEIAYAVEKQKNIVTYRIDENIDTTENNAIEFNVGNIHRINAYELGRYEAIKQKLIPELIAMTQSEQLPPPYTLLDRLKDFAIKHKRLFITVGLILAAVLGYLIFLPPPAAEQEVAVNECTANSSMKELEDCADKGDADAQEILATHYYNGEYTEKDYYKAADYYKKAANQGRASSQYYLAICYYKGDGVPEDRKKSKQWMQKAAKQGYQKAIEALETYYK